MKQRIKFLNTDKSQFFDVLRKRVDEYFVENKISPYANAQMVFKTIVMLSVYFVPYTLIITNSVGLFGMWICSIIMGVGLAGIGMSVMHDAVHGAYSSNKTINNIVAKTLYLIGGNHKNWETQHNVIHHTYTNIYGHDQDVDDIMITRFSPQGKHLAIQKFQVIYVFFFYSMMTIYWCSFKDFVQYFNFIKSGHLKLSKKQQAKDMLYLAMWKIFYFGYSFAIPLFLTDLTFVQVLIGFLSMHVVAGLILSIVFQLAHVVENTTFPVPNETGNIENDWAIHQLQTTADFSSNDPLITFYVGGLNYQAVHHLFPRICHVHYPKIAPIVEQTAKEFGLTYLNNGSFAKAFVSHMRMLSRLGRKDTTFMAIANNMG